MYCIQTLVQVLMNRYPCEQKIYVGCIVFSSSFTNFFKIREAERNDVQNMIKIQKIFMSSSQGKTKSYFLFSYCLCSFVLVCVCLQLQAGRSGRTGCGILKMQIMIISQVNLFLTIFRQYFYITPTKVDISTVPKFRKMRQICQTISFDLILTNN